MARIATQLTLGPLVLVALSAVVSAGPLDEMALDRWAKLREVERYQLNAAEKYYRENQFKVAADEYEKFLKLYEQSVGAPYAQLKWSLCQVQLRNLNTAIKDGFQSVLDYYPDSPEASSAALLIGRTYLGMGDLKAAKKAYDKLLKTQPKHFVAVLARADLVEIAEKEKDDVRRLALLRELTYDVDRTGPANRECVQAARQLARLQFENGDFAEGLKALATACNENDLPTHIVHSSLGNLLNIISTLTGSTDDPAKKKGEKLADAAAAWFREQAAASVSDEKKKAYAVQCWNCVADVQAYARRPEKQREVYEQMIAALGASDELLGKLAGWYKQQGQRSKAREIYGRFQDANEGQNQIALSWREENKPDEAIAIYRRLAASDDKNQTKWLGQVAYTYRHHASKPDLAIAVYRELIASDVANAPNWLWEVAMTLYQYKRWSEALTAFRGTENFPSNYQHMAVCNRQLKKYDEAIALYRQVMAGHPASASGALLEIARTYEEAGKKEDAIKTFKQVCDRFPKTSEGSTAHRHLNDVYKITVTLGGAKD